ncbi:hypothetical protein [Adlercreutzia sp. ZJ242]|uniref:hypothetical protein n=1 Tax=Adlercreutzia sp. ZJ242 TaxID=2709409 RepID=UPI0013EBACE1|nr:hypothetical protein [Adlercreutzia sp. ZJ242]
MGKRFLTALAACALAMSLMAPVAAWADEGSSEINVSGADHYGAVDKNGNIDVLMVTADAGTELYVSVEYGGKTILKDFQHVVSSEKAAGEPELIMLSSKGINLDHLDRYMLTVKAGSPNSDPCYTGKFQPVYGSMDGDQVLIGVRTLAADGSEDAREFTPSSTFFCNGSDYKLAECAQPGEDGVYRYERFSASESIAGRIVYVDQNGAQIRETPIDGISPDAATTVKLPTLVERVTSEGKTIFYRVVHPGNTLTVAYPGQTEFTVHCKQMTFELEQGEAANQFLAVIEYYDTTTAGESGEGALLMTDQLSVTKDFVYTVPTQFSQMRAVGEGDARHNVMLTYGLCGDQPSSAVLGNGKLTINAEVPYGFDEARSSDNVKYYRVNYQVVNDPEKNAHVTYTVRYINAAESTSSAGTVLKTQEVTVTREQPTVSFEPEASIEVEGVTLVPYGSKFELKYSTTASPVYDIYYVPKDYTPKDSYEVTVNYVNIANDDVLQTGKVTIDPTVAGEMLIGPAPETIQVDGNNYVRLDGQSEAFLHSYFTPARTYTVYYRDSRDTQYGNTVVRNTVVRYIDEGVVNDGAADDGAADGGTTTAQASLAAAGGQLSAVDDGTGAGVLLNNEGVDTATERELLDDSTPLAQGLAKSQEGAAGIPIADISAGVLLAAAAALGLFFWLRKRGNREKSEARS